MSTEINDKLDEILARAEEWTATSINQYLSNIWSVPAGKLTGTFLGGCEKREANKICDAHNPTAVDVPALVKVLRLAIGQVDICGCQDCANALVDIATILNAAPPQTTGAVPEHGDVTP